MKNYVYYLILLTSYFFFCCKEDHTSTKTQQIVQVDLLHFIDSLNSTLSSVFADTNLLDKVELKDNAGQIAFLWKNKNKPVLIALPEMGNDEGVLVENFHYLFFDTTGKLFAIQNKYIDESILYNDDEIIEWGEKKFMRYSFSSSENLEHIDYLKKEYVLYSINVMEYLVKDTSKTIFSFTDMNCNVFFRSSRELTLYKSKSNNENGNLFPRETIAKYIGASISSSTEIWIELSIETANPSDDESFFIEATVFFSGFVKE